MSFSRFFLHLSLFSKLLLINLPEGRKFPLTLEICFFKNYPVRRKNLKIHPVQAVILKLEVFFFLMVLYIIDIIYKIHYILYDSCRYFCIICTLYIIATAVAYPSLPIWFSLRFFHSSGKNETSFFYLSFLNKIKT